MDGILSVGGLLALAPDAICNVGRWRVLADNPLQLHATQLWPHRTHAASICANICFNTGHSNLASLVRSIHG
jgi:hypothetical protein